MSNGFSLPGIEQALVSSAMQWPEETFRVIDQYKINSEFFQTSQNRLLFNSLEHFYRDGNPLDLVAFTNKLRELELLDNVGGPYYVTHTWCNCCYSPLVASYYCDLIEAAHAKLTLYRTCSDSITQSEAPGSEAEVLIPDAIRRLEGISVGTTHRKQRTFKEMVQDRAERLQGKAPDIIIPTELIKLDESSPLYPCDMPLIAGARKAGKTILALTLTLNLARRGLGVAYFSLEDTEEKIMERLSAAASRVSVNKKHANELDKREAERMRAAILELSALPIHVRDSDHKLGQIEAAVRELVAREKIKVAVIDYAQIVRVPESKDTNREQKVAEVSRSLRLLAMECRIVIFCLCQLNKEGQTRESMALEQDCTAMWLLESVKNEPNKRSFKIPFQRNGPSGVFFPVTFLGEIARVENFVSDDDEV